MLCSSEEEVDVEASKAARVVPARRGRLEQPAFPGRVNLMVPDVRGVSDVQGPAVRMAVLVKGSIVTQQDSCSSGKARCGNIRPSHKGCYRIDVSCQQLGPRETAPCRDREATRP